jgi:hypothetical protein
MDGVVVWWSTWILLSKHSRELGAWQSRRLWQPFCLKDAYLLLFLIFFDGRNSTNFANLSLLFRTLSQAQLLWPQKNKSTIVKPTHLSSNPWPNQHLTKAITTATETSRDLLINIHRKVSKKTDTSTHRRDAGLPPWHINQVLYIIYI